MTFINKLEELIATERAYQERMNKGLSPKLSWKNILDCKKWYGHISAIADQARMVGYEYFIWNDRIYKTSGTDGWTDTNKSMDDIQ